MIRKEKKDGKRASGRKIRHKHERVEKGGNRDAIKKDKGTD